MLSNLAQKREQFILSVKRNAREETFRKIRLSKHLQTIPFSLNSNYVPQSYIDAYEQGRLQQINFTQSIDDSIEQCIFRIEQLCTYFNENDCPIEYDIASDINIIMKVFNTGYPQIDRSCLHILLTFSAGNHQQTFPLLEHVQMLVNYFNSTTFIELQEYILDILSNIAVDCYQCRDYILLLQIPIKVCSIVIKSKQKNLIATYYTLITNLDKNKPEINIQKLAELHDCLKLLYQLLYESKQKFWILKLLNRIFLFDKSKLDEQFLNFLLNENIEINLLGQEIFKSFQFISTIESEINIKYHIIKIMKNQLIKLKAQKNDDVSQAIKKGLAKRIFATYQNFILDDPQIIEELEFHLIIQNSPIFFLELQEYYSLIDCIVKESSDQTVCFLNKDYILINLVIDEIHNYNEQDGIDHLTSILNLILRLIMIDKENLKIFYEQNLESKICELNHDLANTIFNYLDQQ